jgi:uncharacterized protein YndB with AHSA1/START domain
MSETSTNLGEVTYTRTYAAPRELVFECMTTPEHLAHFWGPVGVSTPVENIIVDLRPGGVFETKMVSDDSGDEFTMSAVFVEIVVPERIAFTEPGVEGGMRTTINFIDLGDGTTETVTHQTNIPEMFMSPEAQAGMQSSFDKFDRYLETL